jgi:hypothetical protein
VEGGGAKPRLANAPRQLALSVPSTVPPTMRPGRLGAADRTIKQTHRFRWYDPVEPLRASLASVSHRATQEPAASNNAPVAICGAPSS